MNLAAFGDSGDHEIFSVDKEIDGVGPCVQRRSPLWSARWSIMLPPSPG